MNQEGARGAEQSPGPCPAPVFLSQEQFPHGKDAQALGMPREVWRAHPWSVQGGGTQCSGLFKILSKILEGFSSLGGEAE